MTSLDAIIRNALGDSFVSATAVENADISGTELWVDVIYDTRDDSLEGRTMMGVIAAVQNWDGLDGRLPTVNFVSSKEVSDVVELGRRTA